MFAGKVRSLFLSGAPLGLAQACLQTGPARDTQLSLFGAFISKKEKNYDCPLAPESLCDQPESAISNL